MSFLPIVERELRVASRQRGTYYSRLGGVASSLVFAGIMMISMQHQRPSETSAALFTTLSTLSFIFCLVAGARFTADCVSEEKREGTLGLLFLTDLKGFDVVLGKLAACSIPAFYGLLAMAPVLTVPLLLGGVRGSEVFRAVLVLVTTLLFSLSVGVFCSALSRRPRSSMALTTFAILAVTGGIPWLGLAYAMHYHLAGSPQFFLLPSPGYALSMVPELRYSTNPGAFWTSCSLIFGLSVALLILASVFLPNCWQDRPAGASLARFKELWGVWTLGGSGRRHQWRAEDLDCNPVLWLSTRHRMKAVTPWVFLGLTASGWVWIAFKVGDDWFNEATYFLTCYFLFGLMKLWVTSEAVSKFNEDRRSGALELILASPLKVAEILSGQLLALRRQFVLPIMVVGAVGAVFMLAPFWSAHLSASGNMFWSVMFLAGLIVFFLDLIACGWTGMWVGLNVRQINRASGTVVGRVLLLPWMFCFLTFAGIVSLGSLGFELPDFKSPESVSLGVWFFYSIANSLFWIAHSRRSLMRSFRDLGTLRTVSTPEKEKPLWRRLLGRA